MLKKTAFAALVAAGTMSVAAVAFAAAETPAPAPVAAPAVTATMPAVSMGDALLSAEKAYTRV